MTSVTPGDSGTTERGQREGKKKKTLATVACELEGETQGPKTPHAYLLCPMLGLEGVSDVEAKLRNKGQRQQGHPLLSLL